MTAPDPSESTATLLSLLRQGDESARERLMARYLPMLRRWAHGRLPQYARDLKEPAAYDDIARQFLLVARHTRDPRTGLMYHGWDAARAQKWADTATGLSANFWGRAMGWYEAGEGAYKTLGERFRLGEATVSAG